MEPKLEAFKKFYDKINDQYKEFFKQYLEEMYDDEGLNPFVFNKDSENINFSKVKYILVGDNPGYEEQKVSRYLIGEAGQTSREFFKNRGLVDNFEEEVLVLNKTFLFTKKTNDLDKIYYKIKQEQRDCMEKIEEYMAELIFKIHKEFPKIKPIIIEFAGCKNGDKWLLTKENGNYYRKGNILPFFFEKLRELYITSNLDNPLILKHFSYDHFIKDYEENEDEAKSVLKNLLTISSNYSKGLFE